MTGPTGERVQANDRRSQKGVGAAKTCNLETQTRAGQNTDMKPGAGEISPSDGDGYNLGRSSRSDIKNSSGRGEGRYLLRLGAWQQSVGDAQVPRWEPKRGQAGVSRNIQTLNWTKWVRLVRW